MPFRAENRHTTLALLALVTGIMVAGAGILFWLAERQDDRFADRALEREQADRAYADCLTDFAADLVTSLEKRTQAAAELEDARERKDDALDALLRISARAQAYDVDTQDELPPGLVKRYEATLTERIAAQRAYDRIDRKLEKARAANPYISPKVVCNR